MSGTAGNQTGRVARDVSLLRIVFLPVRGGSTCEGMGVRQLPDLGLCAVEVAVTEMDRRSSVTLEEIKLAA